MEKDMKIEIIPLGSMNSSLLDYLRINLAEIFSAQVAVGEKIPLPRVSFDPKRHQYLSAPILDCLAEINRQKRGIALGVMDEDVYTPGLNFIFGQAESGKKLALISLKRLSPSFYGLGQNESLYFLRALKEAVHEIGHVLSLDHCLEPTCVMFFSNSILDTDRKGVRFCADCRKKLG